MGTSVLPQRQENAGFAAVVARGGGPGRPGKHLSQGSASSGAPATAGKCRIRCRCGKGRRTGVAREVPPAGIGQFRGSRNGRKMQDSLPLWQGAEDRGGQGSASRRGRPVPGLPQRQENAGFAAVVARGGGPGRSGGQRQASGPYPMMRPSSMRMMRSVCLAWDSLWVTIRIAALLVDLVQELHDLGTHLGVQVTGGLVR